MNRPIKFRAWDKHEKCMYAWADLTPEMPVGDPKANLDEYFNRNYSFEFMQFTGLTDKNGKEVFEGDILLYEKMTHDGLIPKDKYEIRWSEPNSGFWCRGIYPFTLGMAKETRVIGNIYETPELLTP